MNSRPFPAIRTSPVLLTAVLCSAIAFGIACGGSPDPVATETSQPTLTPTAFPDEEPEPTVPSTTSDTSARDWNVLGSPDALVTVLDYSDFQ